MGKNNKPYTTESFKAKLIELNINVELKSEYKNNKTKIKIKCLDEKCGYEGEVLPSNLLKRGCPGCGNKRALNGRRKTTETFKEELKLINPNIRILGEYVNIDTKIKCQCLINEEHVWETTPYNLLNRKYSCPYCAGRLVSDKNSIFINRPDLLKYFINKDDAKEISLYSSKRINLKCPDCGTERTMIAFQLTTNGFYCNICGDNISFNNKLIRNMVLKRKEYFDFYCFEFSPDWLKPLKIDCYLEIKKIKIAIEMDGEQHKTLKWNGKEDLKIKERDIKKEKLCIKNGIVVVKIDCSSGKIEEIIEQFMNNTILDFFHFSKNEWDEIIKESHKNIIKKVCDIYNSMGVLADFNKIGKDVGISYAGVNKFLNIGHKLNWCVYSKYEKIYRMSCNYNNKIILIRKDDKKLLGIFNSKEKVRRYFRYYFNKGFGKKGINYYINNEIPFEGILICKFNDYYKDTN